MLPFSQYPRFKSNGLELSKCQILGQTFATIWWKKKQGSRSRFPRKDSKRMSMPAWWRESLGFRFHCQSLFKGGWPYPDNSKLVKALTVQKVTSRNPKHSAGAYWHGYPWKLHSQCGFFKILQWFVLIRLLLEWCAALRFLWSIVVVWFSDQLRGRSVWKKIER